MLLKKDTGLEYVRSAEKAKGALDTNRRSEDICLYFERKLVK